MILQLFCLLSYVFNYKIPKILFSSQVVPLELGDKLYHIAKVTHILKFLLIEFKNLCFWEEF